MATVAEEVTGHSYRLSSDFTEDVNRVLFFIHLVEFRRRRIHLWLGSTYGSATLNLFGLRDML